MYTAIIIITYDFCSGSEMQRNLSSDLFSNKVNMRRFFEHDFTAKWPHPN
jgi:hypothetical protein